jgi:hypothetical protein
MAAWSGLVPPPNPRRSAPFPTFAAAVPRGFTGEPIPALFPESTVLHGVAVAAVLVGLPTFVLDDAFKLPVVGYIQSGDFSGLQAFLDADPGRSNLAGLRSTSVPILFMASTHDYWNDPNWGLDLLRELPPFTPKRAVLTTGGHDTVINAYEDLAQQRLTRRWFDRFVKGAQNGVELEPATVASARPFDTAGYNDPAALWPHRLDGPWPAADVTNRRWYLRAAGGLDPAPPAASEAADRVRHQVPANYSLNTFSIALFLPSLFFLSLPLSSFPYTTAPLAADLEIAGRARARLEVTPTGPDFALHAALYAVSAGGTETWLADGIRGVRGGMPVPQTLEIDLAAIDVVVPAGQRLRLRVENHAWFKPPGQNIIRFAPMLRSVDVFVTKEPAAPSQVDVPVRASVRPGLTTRTDSIPLGAPPRVDLFVEARGRAGAAYAVAFSLSGIVPGIVLPGGTLPLVPDGLFLASLGAANSPLFPGTQGALDANGRATAGLALGTLGPLDPSLVGLRISAAAAVFPPGTAEPTNAVDLFLR